MSLRMRRAYERPEEEDGARYLVERLWPRGVRREALQLTAWLKDLAPGTELRRWYGHDPQRWPEFAFRYRAELEAEAKHERVRMLAAEAESGPVTLVFATHDHARSGAAVLHDLIRGLMRSETGATRQAGQPVQQEEDQKRRQGREGPETRRERMSTYSRSHDLHGEVLSFNLGEEVEALRKDLAASNGTRTAKTLVKEGPLSVTLVALRAGASLEEHEVSGPTTIHCLGGHLSLTTALGPADMFEGKVLVLNAGVRHSAEAIQDSTLLLTLTQTAPAA